MGSQSPPLGVEFPEAPVMFMPRMGKRVDKLGRMPFIATGEKVVRGVIIIGPKLPTMPITSSPLVRVGPTRLTMVLYCVLAVILRSTLDYWI